MSVLEVYNDTLRDQLAENGAGSKLEVKQARDGQVFIPDLTSIEVMASTSQASSAIQAEITSALLTMFMAFPR